MASLARDPLLNDPRTVMYSLSVDQYHQMIAAGIVSEGEPFEFLMGKVVAKDRSKSGEPLTKVGLAHTLVLGRLAQLGPKLKALGCHLTTQLPVTLPPNNEPEPDAAIVTGTIDDYKDHHPGAAEVLCIIEVSDASLPRDQTAKCTIYASEGIAMYMILNLQNKTAEVYTQPVKAKGQFAKSTTLKIDQTLKLPTTSGKEILVPLKKLLP